MTTTTCPCGNKLPADETCECQDAAFPARLARAERAFAAATRGVDAPGEDDARDGSPVVLVEFLEAVVKNIDGAVEAAAQTAYADRAYDRTCGRW